MEFRILGPLQIVDDGRPIDVGAAKPRAVLAVLLLNANRVVSRDELVDALWGERAPETAPKALQVYVSQLRKALGRDRIVTRSPGYELRLERDELDLARFETLVAAGELEQALALWRGQPLADLAYEPFAQAEISRLTELRLACVERHVETRLEAGRHAALVSELEALVRQHPLREHLRAQLMLALYRSGRQAEALEVYNAGQAFLDDELGLEPGAELKGLQRAILTHDPSLALEGQAAEDTRPATEASPPEPPPARQREVRKTVTVLLCDVTAAGRELDPEPLRRMTDRGLDELLRPVLERMGATVERSLGGAMAAVFGVPAVHEDDPLRAVRAALEVRDRLAALRAELEPSWGAWLELRAGIGTGEVVTGGDERRPAAAGEAVQSALRRHQAARPGEILLDERTHRLVREAVDVSTQGDRVLLVSVRPLATAHVGRFGSTMVGRERERRRLVDAFEQAVGDSSCQLFTLLGAPGVGKSRLVQEFVDDLPEGTLVARGRCLPYGEGITYWPVVEAVRDAAALDDAAPASESMATLAALLEGEQDAGVVARQLGEVIGLSEHSSSADESFHAVHTFFEALARRHPLVLVFDDIHWGEALFLELVDGLSDRIRDAPVLVVCVARPELLELRPLWGGGKPNATSVQLGPLSEAESVQLVDNLVGATELDDATRRKVVESADGNPLFVEEMLALLLEDGRSEGALEIPPTIQALLAARLDRLAHDERSVVEAASVEGKVFHESSVAELLATEPSALRAPLEALVRKELVRPDKPVFSGERSYGFRHLLIRDAAYESIPIDARAELHERHAGWLERKAGERPELEEILGYHLEQAYLHLSTLGPLTEASRQVGRRAAERLGTAGRRAFLRSDARAGANLVSRAVSLLPPDDPFRVELVPNMRVIQGLPDLTWADRVLTEAVEAAATSGDRRLAAHALVQRGFLRLFRDPHVTPQELIDVSQRSIAVFESLGDDLGLARAWRLVGQAHYLDRRAASCLSASERALGHARQAGDAFEEREIVEWLVIALLLGPTPAADALARCTELLDDRWADPLLHSEVLGAAAALVAMLGRAAEAEEMIDRARAEMEEAGDWIWIVSFWYSFIRVWHGDLAAAEAELRPAHEELARIGETSHFSSIAHALSNVVYLRGRYEEAERLTVECERASRSNDIHSQVLWRSIRAKVLARRGAFDEAEKLAREAVALGEASDFVVAHSDALMDLGEVLELAERPDAAAAAIEAAVRLYQEKGNIVAARRGRDELERLGAAGRAG